MLYPFFWPLVWCYLVLGDTEKVIFEVPVLHSQLAESFPRLSPQAPTLRQSVKPVFPSPAWPNGTESWYEIWGLSPGETYEVRVCWPASYPTEFLLDVFGAQDASKQLESTNSRLKLHERVRAPGDDTRRWIYDIQYREVSVHEKNPLYLRILMSAAFFTHRQDLMDSPQPVDFALVLDRNMFGYIPESLTSLILAAFFALLVAWVLIAPLVYRGFVSLLVQPEGKEKSKAS